MLVSLALCRLGHFKDDISQDGRKDHVQRFRTKISPEGLSGGPVNEAGNSQPVEEL